ncbi:MAG: DUF4337 domain-containing protein [Gemmataceae bacterium]|nr:DUF4337 domain-containing protein [Gemmataceae bacterium]
MPQWIRLEMTMSLLEKVQSTAEVKEPKTLFDKLMGVTPVFLTVLATLLAGLSSSEMTQSQYHRSHAAQQQAKAGDQWSFFQAKRIRGTSLELAADLLPAAGDVAPETLVRTLERLRIACERVRKQRDAVRLRLEEEPNADAYVRKTVEALGAELGKQLDHALQLHAELTKALSSEDAQAAFSLVASRTLPAASPTPPLDAVLTEALTLLAGRKISEEARERIARIATETVRQALEDREAEAAEFNRVVKPIVRRAEKFGEAATALARSVQGLYRTARTTAELDNLPAGLASAVATCLAAAQSARTLADELDRDWKAARHEFVAKTYEHESRINQTLAWLYEIQVMHNDYYADRHRSRSRLFFFGMLASQAGVVAASLSLAVRQRSVLWSAATLAGLGALIFSAYVYLYF